MLPVVGRPLPEPLLDLRDLLDPPGVVPEQRVLVGQPHPSLLVQMGPHELRVEGVLRVRQGPNALGHSDVSPGQLRNGNYFAKSLLIP